jgi:hypothetical protein
MDATRQRQGNPWHTARRFVTISNCILQAAFSFVLLQNKTELENYRLGSQSGQMGILSVRFQLRGPVKGSSKRIVKTHKQYLQTPRYRGHRILAWDELFAHIGPAANRKQGRTVELGIALVTG